MEKNYETKLMFKVTRFDSFKTVMFENRVDAVEYVEMLKEKGIDAGLNKWSWETKIEK